MVTSISVALQGFPRLAIARLHLRGETGDRAGGGLPGRLDGPLLPEHPQKPVIDAAEDTSHGDVMGAKNGR
jgi:hypothetical protein